MAALSPRLAVVIAGLVLAAGSSGGADARIYTCVDPVTKARTASEFPCREAAAPTPVEAAASAEAARQAEIESGAKRAAERADRQLLGKFPDEAAHRRAQVAELDYVIRNLRPSLERFGVLVQERKPLDEQLEFYRGKPIPPGLKNLVDANDAAFAALATVFQLRQMEIADIQARYGIERDRLRKLWGGAPPGSMGLLPAGPSRPG